MSTIKITRCWRPLVHIGDNRKPTTPILAYRRRAPGERAPFQFAVVRNWTAWRTAMTGTVPTRSQLRVALGRMVPLVCGTIGAELARQCGATINVYPLRGKQIYGPDRLPQTKIVTISD